MKALIIDDSEYKIKSLNELLSTWNTQLEIRVSRSFQHGLKSLGDWKPDLVLLDMTLPTSENSSGQLEGRVRIFGGRELLAEIELEEYQTQVIVITQFDHFGDQSKSVDRETLFAQLKALFPAYFRGGVYYSNIDSKWRSSLMSLLRNLKLSK